MPVSFLNLWIMLIDAFHHMQRSRTLPGLTRVQSLLSKNTPIFAYHIVFILFSSIIPTFRRFIRQQRPPEQYDENHIVPHTTPKKTGRGKRTAYKDKPIILLTITKDCVLRTEPCGRDFARNMRRVTCNSAYAGEIIGKTILLKEEQRQGAGSVQSEVHGTESAASYMKRERERETIFLPQCGRIAFSACKCRTSVSFWLK